MVRNMQYKRVLVKFSGEQLAGKHEFGIDPEVARYLAGQVKQALDAGCQVALVAGGGNMVRGAEIAGNGVRRVTADQMGMLSGLINAMALTDVFESEGVPTRCLSMVFAEQIAEPYSYRLAEKHLSAGRVVIVAGGIARPYMTHDTAAVSIGLELDCQVVVKATKVDGVYDKDPAKHKDAVLQHAMGFQAAIENPQIAVMDKAALGLAMEQRKPVLVANIFADNALQRIVAGEHVGTLIS